MLVFMAARSTRSLHDLLLERLHVLEAGFRRPRPPARARTAPRRWSKRGSRPWRRARPRARARRPAAGTGGCARRALSGAAPPWRGRIGGSGRARARTLPPQVGGPHRCAACRVSAARSSAPRGRSIRCSGSRRSRDRFDLGASMVGISMGLSILGASALATSILGASMLAKAIFGVASGMRQAASRRLLRRTAALSLP